MWGYVCMRAAKRKSGHSTDPNGFQKENFLYTHIYVCMAVYQRRRRWKARYNTHTCKGGISTFFFYTIFFAPALNAVIFHFLSRTTVFYCAKISLKSALNQHTIGRRTLPHKYTHLDIHILIHKHIRGRLFISFTLVKIPLCAVECNWHRRSEQKGRKRVKQY